GSSTFFLKEDFGKAALPTGKPGIGYLDGAFGPMEDDVVFLQSPDSTGDFRRDPARKLEDGHGIFIHFTFFSEPAGAPNFHRVSGEFARYGAGHQPGDRNGITAHIQYAASSQLAAEKAIFQIYWSFKPERRLNQVKVAN